MKIPVGRHSRTCRTHPFRRTDTMAETVIAKDYLPFCAQPDRNFLINLCITKGRFPRRHSGSYWSVGNLNRCYTFRSWYQCFDLYSNDYGSGPSPGQISWIRPGEAGRSSGSKFDEAFPLPFLTLVFNWSLLIPLLSLYCPTTGGCCPWQIWHLSNTYWHRNVDIRSRKLSSSASPWWAVRRVFFWRYQKMEKRWWLDYT